VWAVSLPKVLAKLIRLVVRNDVKSIIRIYQSQ
jgi:hypothetical protein